MNGRLKRVGVAAGFAAGLYLGMGLICGLLLAKVIPAINGAGVAYIVATWPCQLHDSACASWFPPPDWAFSFKTADEDDRA
jgi:hypothetical protein